MIHTCVKKYASQLADIAGHDQALRFKVYKKIFMLNSAAAEHEIFPADKC